MVDKLIPTLLIFAGLLVYAGVISINAGFGRIFFVCFILFAVDFVAVIALILYWIWR